MPELPRLNPAIRALDSGKPAFVTFSPAEIGAAQSIGAAGYDGVVFEMEHNPYDIRQLRDCMQYMLIMGNLIDKIGTRLGYAIALATWTLAALGTVFTGTPFQFGVARFFLGLGEAGNFPAAIKTTA